MQSPSGVALDIGTPARVRTVATGPGLELRVGEAEMRHVAGCRLGSRAIWAPGSEGQPRPPPDPCPLLRLTPAIMVSAIRRRGCPAFGLVPSSGWVRPSLLRVRGAHPNLPPGHDPGPIWWRSSPGSGGRRAFRPAAWYLCRAATRVVEILRWDDDPSSKRRLVPSPSVRRWRQAKTRI